VKTITLACCCVVPHRYGVCCLVDMQAEEEREMALLEEMMKNTPALTSQAKEELRKSCRYTKKSKRLVGHLGCFSIVCSGVVHV